MGCECSYGLCFRAEQSEEELGNGEEMSEVWGVGNGGLQKSSRKKGISVGIVEGGQRGEGGILLGRKMGSRSRASLWI